MGPGKEKLSAWLVCVFVIMSERSRPRIIEELYRFFLQVFVVVSKSESRAYRSESTNTLQ